LKLTDDLHDTLLEMAATLSPDSLGAYLNALETDFTRGSRDSLALLNSDRLRNLGTKMLTAFDPKKHDVNALIGFARGAAAALHHERARSRTEFVWTGPRSSHVHPRRSEQVLLDLIDGARASLLIVSYVTLAAGPIYDRINAAIGRSIDVKVLLESSTAFGGRLDDDQVSAMRLKVPEAKYYRWLDRGEDFAGGRVHAKVFVADRSKALLTSANLTGNAMEKNMEAGILVTGGRLPIVVADHFDELIRNGILSPVSD
jgi:cardiolipin synthase A/B